MTVFLKRRKPKRMGTLREDAPIRSPSHLKWVRGHICAAYGKSSSGDYDPNVRHRFHCEGRMEAHHSKTRGAGGGDETVVPLCQFHHAQLDSPGWSQKRFEEVYKLDMKAIAQDLARRSPHLRKLHHQVPGDSAPSGSGSPQTRASKDDLTMTRKREQETAAVPEAESTHTQEGK